MPHWDSFKCGRLLVQLCARRQRYRERDGVMSSLDPCVYCKQDPGQEERAPSDGFNMLSIICAGPPPPPKKIKKKKSNVGVDE